MIINSLGELPGGLPHNWHIRSSTDNRKKYKAMRILFDDLKETPHVKWALWFDDDAWIKSGSWWEDTSKFIDEHKSENICYVGHPWTVNLLEGQKDFIKSQPWYKGLPFESRVSFHQGSYVWLRTDVIRQLDWPIKELNHNGGDVLLGEAIRQQGLPRHAYSKGVAINDSKRRGFSEAPLGCRNERIRR